MRGIYPYTFYLGKEKGGNDRNPRPPDIKYTQCGVTLLMQPCSDSLATVLSGWEETLTGYVSDSSVLREEAEELSTLFKGATNNTLKITHSFDDVSA